MSEPTMSLDEVLGHLDDLIALASNEGLALVAAVLISAHALMAERSEMFALRGAPDPELLERMRQLIDEATARERLSEPS